MDQQQSSQCKVLCRSAHRILGTLSFGAAAATSVELGEAALAETVGFRVISPRALCSEATICCPALPIPYSNRLHGPLTEEDRNEVQAMLGRMMANYMVNNAKTRELIQEIDKARALFDLEWAKEQAMYTTTLEGGAGQNSPLS